MGSKKGYSWHFETILSEMPKKLGTSEYFYRLVGGKRGGFCGITRFLG